MNGVTFSWILIRPGIQSTEYHGRYVNTTNQCKKINSNILVDGQAIGFGAGTLTLPPNGTNEFTFHNNIGTVVELRFNSVTDC
jgi:hypothetical protein